MIGTLDNQVIEKFQEFQEKTGKYLDLDIAEVKFDNKFIYNIISEFIKGATPKYSGQPTNTIVIKSGQARGNYNKFDFTKIAYLDIAKVKNIKYLKKGDILINTTGIGTAGRVTLFDLDNNHVSDSHITALRYDLSKINKFYLLNFFINFGFKRLESMAEGSGGQIELSMSKVKNISIAIPQNYNEKYNSYKIQRIIVEFLEHWKLNYTDIFRKIVTRQKPIIEKIKKAIIPATFACEKTLVNSFSKFVIDKGLNINIEDIKFEEIHITKLIEFSKGKNASLYTKNYISQNKGDIPVFSGKTKDNGIMGYVKEDENTYAIDNNIIFMTTVGKYAMTPKLINGKFNLSQNCAIGTQLENMSVEYLFIQIKWLFDRIKKSRHESQDSFTFEELKQDYLKDIKEQEFIILTTSDKIQKLLVEFWGIINNDIDNKFKRFDRISYLTNNIDESFLYRTFSKINWSK